MSEVPVPAADPVLKNTLEARTAGSFGRLWERHTSAVSRRGLEPSSIGVIQTHYKPFERSRLVFRGTQVRPKGERYRYFFAQLYADTSIPIHRLENPGRGKRRLRSVGPPYFSIPEWNGVAWALPNGPRLRILRSFMQRKAMKRFLRRIGIEHDLERRFPLPELVRYVPRRRALLKWDLRRGSENIPVYIKVYEPGVDETAVANLGELSKRVGELGFRVPTVLNHYERRRVIVMGELPGTRLTSRYTEGTLEEFEAVGKAIAGLHRAGIPTPVDWSLRGELEALRRGMQDVVLALPELGQSLRAQVGALQNAARKTGPAPTVPIHANLFGDQILVDDQGGVGIVDWDDLATGDPHFDLGRLVAHAEFTALDRDSDVERIRTRMDALLAAYSRNAQRSLDQELLRWHVSAALLMRAKISALRTLAPEWNRKVAAALEESRRVLASRKPILS